MTEDLPAALGALADTSPELAGLGGGAWAISKVLGPSVSAVGRALGDWTDYRMRNLLRLNEKVASRISDEDDSGQTVHPRVAKTILDDGSWIDDDLHQEYLAGLLVSARSKDGASDKQAYLARIVSQLTADQVRLHYAVVSAYAGYWTGVGECPFPFGRSDHYRQHSVIVENEDVLAAVPDLPSAGKGLVREGLLQEYGRPIVGPQQETHQVFVPAPLAFDVYLSALGTTPKLNPAVLMLDRARVIKYIVQPDPEPPAFQTAIVANPGG